MNIAMTGVSGNMGAEALREVLALAYVQRVRILLTKKKRNETLCRQLKKQYGNRVEAVFGDIADNAVCAQLVEGADYVIHMAAVIPPRSDADPKASERCNYLGTMTLVDAVKAMPRQAKFVHTSTMALYGCRDEKHPFARVGDPLVISPFDLYSLHKLWGERYVLEAGLEHFAVLRQTAMLHMKMLRGNMSDGLMFHTNLNSPLEWVSARDSGILIRRIVERDSAGEIDAFWNKVYNIGARRAFSVLRGLRRAISTAYGWQIPMCWKICSAISMTAWRRSGRRSENGTVLTALQPVFRQHSFRVPFSAACLRIPTRPCAGDGTTIGRACLRSTAAKMRSGVSPRSGRT